MAGIYADTVKLQTINCTISPENGCDNFFTLSTPALLIKRIFRTHWKVLRNYNAVPACNRAFSELFCVSIFCLEQEVLKYLVKFHRPGSGKYVCSVTAWSCVSNVVGKGWGGEMEKKKAYKSEAFRYWKLNIYFFKWFGVSSEICLSGKITWKKQLVDLSMLAYKRGMLLAFLVLNNRKQTC